jgi:hypothetical protein
MRSMMRASGPTRMRNRSARPLSGMIFAASAALVGASVTKRRARPENFHWHTANGTLAILRKKMA